MKYPVFKSSKELAQPGDALRIFCGMGCRPAVAIKSDKRKTLVRYSTNETEFVKNSRIKIVTDEIEIHEIKREFQ